MTENEIPALLLTVAALYCAVRWTVLLRRGEVRQDTLHAAIGIAALVTVGGALIASGSCAGGEPSFAPALIACAVLVPGLLIAGAIATVGAPRPCRELLGWTWTVILAGCVFAVGSCFAVV